MERRGSSFNIVTHFRTPILYEAPVSGLVGVDLAATGENAHVGFIRRRPAGRGGLMPRPKRTAAAARTRRATGGQVADAIAEERARPAFDRTSLARPLGSRDLVPIFMMIQTDLFRRLNDKAAARRTGYDTLLRTILRDHIGEYPGEQPPKRTGGRSTRRKRG
jgi:hypothetical protein